MACEISSSADLIEPLSLDEAYLDVTENKIGLPTAALVARTIREQIWQELSLAASAGVAPNKFLAKLAWRNPVDRFWKSGFEISDSTGPPPASVSFDSIPLEPLT